MHTISDAEPNDLPQEYIPLRRDSRNFMKQQQMEQQRSRLFHLPLEWTTLYEYICRGKKLLLEIRALGDHRTER